MIRVLKYTLLTYTFAFLAGCAPERVQSTDRLILTSFHPVYIATINVADSIPGVRVENLTRPLTGCLHDYQLTPDDMRRLSKADVFVVNGAGMESFLDDVVKQRPGLRVIVASEGIPLMANEDGTDSHGQDADGHDHAAHAEEVNAHVWVSVSNAATQVRTIAEGLAQWDSANATRYRANAEWYGARLDALGGQMRDSVATLTHRDIVTFHEAFAYLAQDLSLHIAAVIQREPGSEPSASELAHTVELVRASGIKALFAEPQYSARSAHTIAQETGATVYTLDPVVSGPLERGAYVQTMESNLSVLMKALR